MIRKYARRVVEAVLDRAVEELPRVRGLRGEIDDLRSVLERERGDHDRLRTGSINPLEKPLDQARRELADALKREERRSENPSAFWRVADAEDALLETARKRGVGFERLLRDPLLYEARVFVRRQTTRGAYPTDDEIVDHLVRHCRFLRLIPEEGASTSTPFGDVNRAQDPVRLSGIQAGDALIEQIKHAKAILRVTMPMCVCGHPITLHNKDEACVGDAGDHVPCPCDSYTAQERVYTDADERQACIHCPTCKWVHPGGTSCRNADGTIWARESSIAADAPIEQDVIEATANG